MKQIFIWMKEQIQKKALPKAIMIMEKDENFPVYAGEQKALIEALEIINTAETKWEEMQKELVKQLEEEVIALEDNYGDLVNCIPVEVVLKIIGGGTVNA